MDSSEGGTGLFEMKPRLVREDTDQWQPLLGWIAQRPSMAVESPALHGGAAGTALAMSASVMPALGFASGQMASAIG